VLRTHKLDETAQRGPDRHAPDAACPVGSGTVPSGAVTLRRSVSDAQ
jgi:hypothetical protein